MPAKTTTPAQTVAANLTTVTVAGPNLNDPKQSGRMHVHASGCADLKRRRVYRGIEEPWTIEVSGIKDLVESIYGDQIEENPTYTWEDYLTEIDVFPCVTFPTTTGEAKEATPAPTTKPAVVAKADEVKRLNSNRLPQELRDRTWKLVDEELVKEAAAIIKKHGLADPKHLTTVLYWGTAGVRVAISDGRIEKLWAAIQEASKTPAPARRTRKAATAS